MTTNQREKPSMRMCAGCGQRAAPRSLVRLVVGPAPPYLAVDLGRKLGGRGVSVHATQSCLRAAIRRGGLAKALRGVAQVEPETLGRMVVEQLERRAFGLLGAAHRSGKVCLGAEAVRAALQNGKGDLLIRTKDSRGRGDELARAAVALGCATVTWGTKSRLGDGFNRSELGVLLLTDRGIARAVLDCLSHVEALSEDE